MKVGSQILAGSGRLRDASLCLAWATATGRRAQT